MTMKEKLDLILIVEKWRYIWWDASNPAEKGCVSNLIHMIPAHLSSLFLSLFCQRAGIKPYSTLCSCTVVSSDSC